MRGQTICNMIIYYSSDHDEPRAVKKSSSRKINLPVLSKTSPRSTRSLKANRYKSSPELRRKEVQVPVSKTSSIHSKINRGFTASTMVELGSMATNRKCIISYPISKSDAYLMMEDALSMYSSLEVSY